jgi:hypothetical protein
VDQSDATTDTLAECRPLPPRTFTRPLTAPAAPPRRFDSVTRAPPSNYTLHFCASSSQVTFFFCYGSTALVGLGRFFSSLIYTQSVGLLGRVLSPSQSRYLHTGQHKHRINAHRHPCLEWDSNPRSQRPSERRQASAVAFV